MRAISNCVTRNTEKVMRGQHTECARPVQTDRTRAPFGGSHGNCSAGRNAWPVVLIRLIVKRVAACNFAAVFVLHCAPSAVRHGGVHFSSSAIMLEAGGRHVCRRLGRTHPSTCTGAHQSARPSDRRDVAGRQISILPKPPAARHGYRVIFGRRRRRRPWTCPNFCERSVTYVVSADKLNGWHGGNELCSGAVGDSVQMSVCFSSISAGVRCGGGT